MSNRKSRRTPVPRSEQRRGWFGGVNGVSYGISGGPLNATQFGYTTAQAADAAASGTTSGGAATGAGGTV